MAVGIALVHARASAQDDKSELSFSAEQVEGDVRLRELVLRGNVVLTYERFRLTSPSLTLRRTMRGIEVQGPGEVVFCPCPNPPVTIGFEGGTVSPPADLFLDSPKLRVAGRTVFALPWFWLRAPSRPGLLPPNVAFRAADGLLVGGGVHLPWKEGEGYGDLDLTASGYVKGGVEIVARLRTSRSSNRVRWDHLGADLLAVDAHGAYPQPGPRDGAVTDTAGAVAWDIDAIRGPRGRRAALSLDEAARAYDRGAAEAMVRLSSSALFGVGVRAVGARGGFGPSERPVWGPRATLAVGGPIGSSAAWDNLATLTVLHDPVIGSTNLARAEGGLDWSARPAGFVTRLGVREAITAAASGPSSALDAAFAARLEVGLPLARAYPSNPPLTGVEPANHSPLVHVIEPRIRASAMAARTSGAYWASTGRPVALTSGQVAIASAGLRSAWGRLLGHSGASVEADVGGLAPLSRGGVADPVPVARFRTAWSSRYFGLGGEGAAGLDAARGEVLVAKTRFGAQDGWHVTLKAAGRRGFDPLAARALSGVSAEEPSGGWLAGEGWSGGAELGARFAPSVGARVSVEEHLTSRTLLQVRGSLGYTHPCRCISVDGFAGKRLGRDGVDVWVSIDLAPR